MKKSLLQSVFWTIGLASIAGLATNALLMAHLDCCHSDMNTACPHESDAPQPPAHDHAHCLFCQFFMGVGGKYLTPSADVLAFSETTITCSVFYTSHLYTPTTLLAAVPRGPPAA